MIQLGYKSLSILQVGSTLVLSIFKWTKQNCVSLRGNMYIQKIGCVSLLIIHFLTVSSGDIVKLIINF